MSRFLSPALSAVTPYTPGEQPQDQQYIKLNTNESPYLPSPRVVAAVSEAEVEKLRLYSDPACAQLLRTAAAHFGLQPSQIMPGNGSDENLFFALRAFCDESHPLAFADITYGCYGVWCGLLHIPAHIIPLKEDFTLDPADYHGLHETIVIANPNAPTGLCLPREAIEGILQSNPDSVVIVDEAYVDFGGESCVPAGGADLLQIPAAGGCAAWACHGQCGADRRFEPGQVQPEPLQHQPPDPESRAGCAGRYRLL